MSVVACVVARAGMQYDVRAGKGQAHLWPHRSLQGLEVLLLERQSEDEWESDEEEQTNPHLPFECDDAVGRKLGSLSTVDALASRVDEGRGQLRKAPGSG